MIKKQQEQHKREMEEQLEKKRIKPTVLSNELIFFFREIDSENWNSRRKKKKKKLKLKKKHQHKKKKILTNVSYI